MSKRSFRTALVIVAATVVLAGGVVAYFVHEVLSYPEHAHKGKGGEVEVEIKPGMAFEDIAELLAEKGVVNRPRWFRLYAMHRGVANKVRTGRYVLHDDWTPKQVLDTLLAGVQEKQASVTLPEGKNMLEYFALIEKAGIASAKELEAVARDGAFLRAHGIDGDTVEGYLFPETYNFVVPSKPAKVLERLIAQHQAVWNKVVGDNPKAYQRLRDRMKWSDRDILTMASIVEKEAVRADEQPRIAQVFINRLTDPSFSPKKLETDPTIRYGCEVPLQKSAACKAWNVTDRLHRAQLDDADNPYNTYQHEGLPPGPICNPGTGALEAVLDPDGSDYFYFVAKDDQSHAFARSLGEHERNVKKYMLGQ